MLEFVVGGPFKVPLVRANTGAVDLDIRRCFEELPGRHDGFQGRGCYVFSLSVPYGYRPAYVGKTVHGTIIKEAFNPSNQLKITRYLNDIKRVDGLFISIVHKSSRGWAKNSDEISELEEWLIANAASKNPELLNRRSVPKKNWRIKGVENSGVGRPDTMAVEFRSMMGIGSSQPKKLSLNSTSAVEFIRASGEPQPNQEPSVSETEEPLFDFVSEPKSKPNL